MSLVALPARSASLRTSSATTAKRSPDSPAPAASIAALRARRFVWDAMSSMVLTMFEISSDRSPKPLIFFEIAWTSPRMRCMPSRLFRTARSPFWAASRVSRAARAEASALCGHLPHGMAQLVDGARDAQGLARLRLGARGHLLAGLDQLAGARPDLEASPGARPG